MELGKSLEHRCDEKKLRELGGFSPEKTILRREGNCSQVGVGLFIQVTSDRARIDSFKLCQERFRLDIEVNFFIERVVSHRTGCPW